MMPDAARRSTVLVVGPLPPPVHGFSLATALMIERLAALALVDVVDTSPGSLVRDWRYHGRRLRRVCRALLRVLRPRAGGLTLYLATAGGAGVIYDLVLVALARMRRCRIFIHHHAFTYINRRTRRTAALIAAAGPAATHICLCRTMARRLREQYPRLGATALLSNAALLAPPAPPDARGDGPLRLGFLSNLMPEKGLDTVIELFRALRHGRAGLRLVVAGPATEPAMRRLLDEAGREFGAALDYRGAVYGAQKAAFFRDIDVFLFPTRYPNEAQPLVVMEALAAGVPVIATARGCLPDDLASGGLVVIPEEAFVAEAAAAIVSWDADRRLLSDLSRQAGERALALHAVARGDLAALIDAMTLAR